MEWTNYGDVNPMEHGGQWIKQDEVTPTAYNIMVWKTLDEVSDEEQGYLCDGYVDLTDDWIEWDSVNSTMDINEDSTPEVRALAVFDYYGSQELQGTDDLLSKSEALNYLSDHNIYKEDAEEPSEVDALEVFHNSMVNKYQHDDHEDGHFYEDGDED